MIAGENGAGKTTLLRLLIGMIPVESGEILIERRKLLYKTLNEFGLRTAEPKGAFYIFPEIRSTGLTSEAFAGRLLNEKRVALIPGNGFGKGGEGFVRISYATAYEKIEIALERIRSFLKDL